MNSARVSVRPTQKIWDYASTFATTFGCLILTLVAGTISARILGPTGRGELAVLLYFPALMSSLFVLGLPQAITYEIAQHPRVASNTACAGLYIAAATSVLGALFFVFLIPYFLTPDKRYLTQTAQLICLIAFSCGFNAHLLAIARGHARFGLVNKMLLYLSAGNLVGIVLLSFSKMLTSVSAGFMSQLLQASAMVFLLFSLKQAFTPFRFDWIICKVLIVRGARLFWPSTVLLVYSMLDRGILMRTVTLEQLGLYGVAFTVASPITLAIDPINQISFVELSGEQNPLSFRTLFLSRFYLTQFVVLASCVTIAILVKPALLIVFGAKFTNAQLPAYVLCLAMACQAMAKVVDSALRAADHLAPVIYSNAIAGVFLVAASIPLIHYGQLVGFCIAFVLAEILRFVLLLCALSRSKSVGARDLWGLRVDVGLLLLSQIRSLAIKFYPWRRLGPTQTP
jgi:O-antigen/teichoic acid export membrane protein